MPLTWATAGIKSFLINFNVACVMISFLLIYFGKTGQETISGLQHETSDIIIVLSALSIGIGYIMLFIACFGCCGAHRESICMILTYAFSLLIIIIIEIVIASQVSINLDYVREESKKEFAKIFEDRDRQSNVTDLIQTILQCCGKSSAVDWLGRLPQSCCQTGTAPRCVPWTTGCQDALGKFIDSTAVFLERVALGVATVELVGLIGACWLANGIRNNRNRAAERQRGNAYSSVRFIKNGGDAV